MTEHEIYYASFYGSTRAYADALAQQLGCTAQEIGGVAPAAAGGPILVLAPMHGPSNAGVSFIKELPAEVLEARPVCLATVGMTLDHVVQEKDPAASLLGSRAGQVHRFYLPGRLNYSELSTGHTGIMRGIVSALRLKPGKSENDRMMIDTYGKDTDRVDLERLAPIVQWARDAATGS